MFRLTKRMRWGLFGTAALASAVGIFVLGRIVVVQRFREWLRVGHPEAMIWFDISYFFSSTGELSGHFVRNDALGKQQRH